MTRARRPVHADRVTTRAATLLALALAGCAPQPLELSVDVRTDLAPGTAFTSVRVELTPDQGDPLEPVVRSAGFSDPFDRGVRIADFSDLAHGTSRVRATLRDQSGADVLSRSVEVLLQEDYALTIVLSTACASRVCPGTGDPAGATECVSGYCVEPGCGGPTPVGCEMVACETQNDCVGLLGCAAACIEGACVCDGPAAPDAGPPDAGPCPGECTPDDMQSDTQACGMCGEGTQTRTRTCGADCSWGAYSDWGTCTTSAECTPGQTDQDSRACGNCDRGTQQRMRSCDSSSCTWGSWSSWGSCSGGGTCAPGATRSGCDPCGVEVCSSSCNWGSCQPRSGAQCLFESGTHWRCCGSSSWQYCLSSSCSWSTSCAPCTGCGC